MNRAKAAFKNNFETERRVMTVGVSSLSSIIVKSLSGNLAPYRLCEHRCRVSNKNEIIDAPCPRRVAHLVFAHQSPQILRQKKSLKTLE